MLRVSLIHSPLPKRSGAHERRKFSYFLLLTHCLAATAGAPLPLQPLADVPLGGHATRLDYASVDTHRHLLFIAHLGDSAVIVFDTGTQQLSRRINGISEVHGVLAVPELDTAYASATGTNEIVAIDEGTLAVTARMPGGVYPDGIAYAPAAHKLYVSDEAGRTETVIDVRTRQRLATIPLGGEAGNSQYDPATRHIFVNVQTLGELIEIDPATDRVTARIKLPGAQSNHGLLIEPQQRRAFIACEHNRRLLVLDLETRQVTGSFEVGETPDVLAYDPGLQYLYVATESGVVSLFKAEPREIRLLGSGHVGPNAHVAAVDPATHKVFFPLKSVGGQPVLRIMSPLP